MIRGNTSLTTKKKKKKKDGIETESENKISFEDDRCFHCEDHMADRNFCKVVLDSSYTAVT